MNMFAKNAARSVEEYLSLIPADRKKEIDLLHDFIQKAVPKLKPYFASNMIGYGKFYYLDSKKQKKGLAYYFTGKSKELYNHLCMYHY